ncbi:MAG: Gfo/Idh/MocA family oxidoreductase [Bacteroidales bacterium]|jgi:hypothetical protein|nr:Gfo/Idh/MocA family oxidoreductase [Bacteroidales bacterium]
MIRIGIVGTDVLAHLHTAVLMTNNSYEIVGCYALENRESMVFARQNRLVSYSSLDALFKYTDAIDITDDVPEIMFIAERALKEMKHVYITHPQNLSLDEIQYLVKLANESGVILQLATRHRYCPVYNHVSELGIPRVVEVKHHMKRNKSELCTQIKSELAYDLDFILGIMNANIAKIDVKTWSVSERNPDLLNCRLECDNGSYINIMMHTILDGDPKIDFMFNFPDVIVQADIFKPVIEKQYCAYDVVDQIEIENYNSKMVYKQDFVNFEKAILDDPDMLSQIEQQLQCFAAADVIVERIRQVQTINTY